MTMEAHGYEYYEARAKDVKLEDVTSNGWNKDILAKLRDNDPGLTYISIATELDDDNDFVIREGEGDDLGWLGYFIGRSKQLETLYIDDFPDNINIDAFLRGLGHNRSIQNLQISKDLEESIQGLAPFLRNDDSLCDLSFTNFHIGLQCARNIALLLGQQSSLTLNHLGFDDTGLGDEGLLEVVVALRAHPQIEGLSLPGNNNIGREGYAALGSMLEGWRNPNLTYMDLANSDIDDEGLCALVAGLRNCHNLTSLNLNGNESITEVGLRSLSTLFQSDSCRLEHLYLSRINVDNDGVSTLAPGLASLPSLTQLNLYGNAIGDPGLQALVEGLISCNLEVLDVSNNAFSVPGMRSLGTLVRMKPNMQSLNLRNSSVTDEGLQCLVEGMANCCSLTFFDLSCNRSITANGLASLSSLLRAKHCSLSNLVLYGIDIGDDGAAALANGLIGNTSLTNLAFSVEDMTARRWATFSRLLCDTSSVNNTYLSNHTLVRIGVSAIETPQDIKKYLKWNKSLKQQAAAICKILRSHTDINVTPLFQWKLKCLPLVLAWLEKAKAYLGHVNEPNEVFKNRRLSAVYKFVRGMPQLVVDGYRRQNTTDVQSNSKKRKFDLTL